MAPLKPQIKNGQITFFFPFLYCFEIILKLLCNWLIWSISRYTYLAQYHLWVVPWRWEEKSPHLKEAVRSGILPPAAWHAAPPEPHSVNHFKEESFSRYKIIFFLQKLKLHLVPPSPNTVTEISSQKHHVLKTPLWRKWWIYTNGRSKCSPLKKIKFILPRVKISHISNSRLDLTRFQY